MPSTTRAYSAAKAARARGRVGVRQLQTTAAENTAMHPFTIQPAA